MRVSYEDLARSTREALTDLFQRLLSDAEWRFENIGTSDNRHQLYGNRMRSQTLSFADIKEDDGWRSVAPARCRRLVSRLTWSLRGR